MGQHETELSRNCILVADGDAGFRERACALVGGAGYEASQATTGAEAIEAARRLRPRLVLLDVHLPELCGYEVCKTLRDEFGPALPVVLVSAERTEPSDRVAGLLIGADEYLVKPIAADELLARVRALLRRSAPAAAAEHELTARELQVLALLADGRPTVDIASELFITANTVRTHVENILRKLRVHSRSEAVALAFRTGILDASS